MSKPVADKGLVQIEKMPSTKEVRASRDALQTFFEKDVLGPNPEIVRAILCLDRIADALAPTPQAHVVVSPTAYGTIEDASTEDDGYARPFTIFVMNNELEKPVAVSRAKLERFTGLHYVVVWP